MNLPQQYLAIDIEGFALSDNGSRIVDQNLGHSILSSIQFAENGAFCAEYAGANVFVEAFDQPLVVQHIEKVNDKTVRLLLPYDYSFKMELTELYLDEWDRVHGFNKNKIPFVFSRNAQIELFNMVDEYDDESLILNGEKIPTLPWLSPKPEVTQEKYWSEIYQSEDPPGWELNQPAPALVKMLPQLKLPKSRVLVLGAGSGNDAALFAQAGHWVTAVDITDEAIANGQKKYGHLSQLNWVKADLFKLPEKFIGQFDLIFEHTCFCAIAPEKRNQIIKVWRQCLAENGKLMGVFFTMEKKTQPPFGATEWELNERLKKDYRFIYWKRWRESIERRNGKELFVYAEKKSYS
jgi:SAM-dependent methyltransferase